jgi:hypothetical protein
MQVPAATDSGEIRVFSSDPRFELLGVVPGFGVISLLDTSALFRGPRPR